MPGAHPFKVIPTVTLTLNDLEWVGARHLYLNFDDPRFLVLISGYPRFLTSFFCMTLGSQGKGHRGNDFEWVGARHLYLNFEDPRFLVLISGYPRFLTSCYLRLKLYTLYYKGVICVWSYTAFTIGALFVAELFSFSDVGVKSSMRGSGLQTANNSIPDCCLPLVNKTCWSGVGPALWTPSQRLTSMCCPRRRWSVNFGGHCGEEWIELSEQAGRGTCRIYD